MVREREKPTGHFRVSTTETHKAQHYGGQLESQTAYHSEPQTASDLAECSEPN
jgi:hypothetical protein